MTAVISKCNIPWDSAPVQAPQVGAIAHLFLLLLPILLTIFISSTAYCIGATEKVILICIDGLRSPEGLDDLWIDAPSDTSVGVFQYMPLLAGEYSSYGTLFSNFYSNAQTITTPANDAIVTGLTEWAPNIGGSYGVSCWKYYHRPFRPTIFEMFRLETGAPIEKALAVVSKVNTENLHYSLDPALGEKLGGYIRALSDEVCDSAVADTAVSWMRTHEPDLLFIHFGKVDYEGHYHNNDYDVQWHRYIDAIHQVDSLIVKKIIKEIQRPGNPYCNKTTVLIFTDHGRHDFAPAMGYDPWEHEGEFHNHGGLCRGCRTSFLLGFGPDIKRGYATESPYELKDISSTVAYLLDFEMPEADGRIMTEMFENYMHPPTRRIFRDKPRIACRHGKIHSVWMKTDTVKKSRDIWYATLDAAEVTETIALDESMGTIISNSALGTGQAADNYDPYIAVDTDTSLSSVAVAWQSVASVTDSSHNHTDMYCRFTDNGDADPVIWEDPRVVAESQIAVYDYSRATRASPPTGYYSPAIAVAGGGNIKAFGTTQKSLNSRLYSNNSDDGGNTWSSHEFLSNGRVIGGDRLGGYCQGTDLACRGDSIYAAWMDCTPRMIPGAEIHQGVWNIRFGAALYLTTRNWNTVEALSDTMDCLYALSPALCMSESHLNVAWRQQMPGNSWKIVNRHHHGGVMEEAEPISPSNCMMPDMAARDETTFIAVYSKFIFNYKESFYNIAWSASTDGGATWSYQGLVSPSSYSQLQPQVASDPRTDAVYVIWKEYRNRKSLSPEKHWVRWEIKLAPIDCSDLDIGN